MEGRLVLHLCLRAPEEKYKAVLETTVLLTVHFPLRRDQSISRWSTKAIRGILMQMVGPAGLSLSLSLCSRCSSAGYNTRYETAPDLV